MAKNDPKHLMDLELEFLIYSSQSSTPAKKREWFKTTGYGSPYSMTFEDYIVSTKNAGDLALVFHGSYERSSDDAKRKQNRIDFANYWYDYFSK